METKRFIVVDTRNNSTTSFESIATTVAELKADMMEHGIDPTGMLIQEGLTKTEFTRDDTVLPTNVAYRGGVTNNLVFRLTFENRKIKSGVENTRANAYILIREMGLKDIINDTYGKNYTTVKTEDLYKIIDEYMAPVEEENDEEENTQEKCTYVYNEQDNNKIDVLVNILLKKHVLTECEANKVLGNVHGYTNNEITEMFSGM